MPVYVKSSVIFTESPTFTLDSFRNVRDAPV